MAPLSSKRLNFSSCEIIYYWWNFNFLNNISIILQHSLLSSLPKIRKEKNQKNFAGIILKLFKYFQWQRKKSNKTWKFFQNFFEIGARYSDSKSDSKIVSKEILRTTSLSPIPMISLLWNLKTFRKNSIWGTVYLKNWPFEKLNPRK